jgi:hypothetical protein
LADLYYSTGSVYDLLCFTFYYAAFLSYLRFRAKASPLGWRHILVVLFLYLCALAAKEMAVTLPLFLLLYELLHQPPRRTWTSVRHWLFEHARTLTPMALLGHHPQDSRA